MENQVKERKPTILFCSPMNVLDISSGAALSMRTILSQLVKRGYRVRALGATLFDSSHGGEHVIEAGKQAQDKKLLRTTVFGIEMMIVRTKAPRRADMTCEEQEGFYRCYRLELRDNKPDAIILWGGMLLEMTMMREARTLGIPVIFYLVNSGYKWLSTFDYVSTVVTDTQATAQMYWERHQMKVHPLGKFIDPDLIKAESQDARYITFINPSFEKGVNTFMPIAKLAAEKYPEIEFLVVQSRGRWANALKALKFKPDDFPNVRIVGHQKDMRKVYGISRAVLLPSAWIESGARVIPESLINGVPVIGSNTGGSAELIGKGGVVLDLPEKVREEKLQPAPPEVAEEWLEVVRKVWFDEEYYKTLLANVATEAERHDINRNVDKLLRIIEPIMKAAKGDASVDLTDIKPFKDREPLLIRQRKDPKAVNRKQARSMASRSRKKKKK